MQKVDFYTAKEITVWMLAFGTLVNILFGWGNTWLSAWTFFTLLLVFIPRVAESRDVERLFHRYEDVVHFFLMTSVAGWLAWFVWRAVRLAANA